MKFSPGDAFNRSSDDSANPDAEQERVEVEKELSYTRHTSRLELTDGTERTVEWDAASWGDHGVQFKDYNEVRDVPIGGKSPAGKAKLFVPYGQLRWFETVDRRTETLEYTDTVKREVTDA